MMDVGATGRPIRRWLRGRWIAVVTVALIVALDGAGAFVAAGAAARTTNAYARYLERAEVGDVLINPLTVTVDIDSVIRDLPGVRAVSTRCASPADVVDGLALAGPEGYRGCGPRRWALGDGDG